MGECVGEGLALEGHDVLPSVAENADQPEPARHNFMTRQADAATLAAVPGAMDDASLVASLQDGLRRLSACSAEVFLALGGALQSIAAQARDVAGVAREAAERGAASESSQSIHTLQSMLADASQIQSVGQVSRSKLHEVLAPLQECHLPMSRLLRLPMVLETVGMLYRIEASRVESATVNASTLTGEMKSMTGKINKHVFAAGEQAAGLLRMIKESTVDLDRIEEQGRNQGAELIRQTGDVIGSFRARLEAANHAALGIEQQYGEIRQATDKIVLSLQSEDIARQRIEHVEEALSHVTTNDQSDHVHRGNADVLVLQRSQLFSTRNLLGDSIEAVRDGLRSVGSHLDALTERTSALASNTDEDGDSFSTEVHTKILMLSTMVRPYADSARKVVSTVDSVLPGLAAMTRAIREVENIHASIRVLALNAKIKTNRLGKYGAVMGALAVELHEIARQSDSDTQAMVDGLQAMQSPLKELAEQKDASLSSKMMNFSSQEMQREMGGLIDSVVADSQKLSKTMAALFKKSAQLRVDLKGAAEVAERAGTILETFDSVLNELDANLKHMGYAADAVIAHDGKAAKLAALYTMHSERHVHEQVFGPGKTSPEKVTRDHSSQKPTSGSTADELGSNVDLF